MDDDDRKFAKHVLYIVGGFFLLLFSVFAGCSMHGHVYESAHTLADAKYATVQNAASLERVKAVERLIKNGIDPIAARCAVYGWNKTEKSEMLVCANSRKLHVIMPNE